MLVRSRGDLTFEEAKPQLKAAVPTLARTAFQDWFIAAGQGRHRHRRPAVRLVGRRHRHGRPARGRHHLDDRADRPVVDAAVCRPDDLNGLDRLVHHLHARRA